MLYNKKNVIQHPKKGSARLYNMLFNQKKLYNMLYNMLFNWLKCVIQPFYPFLGMLYHMLYNMLYNFFWLNNMLFNRKHRHRFLGC